MADCEYDRYHFRQTFSGRAVPGHLIPKGILAVERLGQVLLEAAY